MPAGRASRGYVLATMVCAAAFWVACSRGSDAVSDAVVRDSMGVTIVENVGDVWSKPAAFSVSPDPLLRIGQVDGDEPYLFERVVALVALSDGAIVVANVGDNTIRWFDGAGAFLMQRGGRGEGPAELRRVVGMVAGAADSVIVTDATTRRLLVFSREGDLGRTVELRRALVSPGRLFRLADGSFVISQSGFVASQLAGLESGVIRVPTPLLVVSADGLQVDTVGVFPGLEMEILRFDGQTGTGSPLFAKWLSYAGAGDRVYVGTADQLVIDVYSRDGELRRSHRALDVDLTIGQDVVDAFRGEMLSQLPDQTPEERAQVEQMIAAMSVPETRPAYATFLPDAVGNLLVAERSLTMTPSSRWLVFGPDGAVTGIVTMPAGFEPLTFAEDRVFGTERDDMGVQYVVAYEIER